MNIKRKIDICCKKTQSEPKFEQNIDFEVLYNVMATSSDCDADLSSAIIHFDDLKFSPLTIQVPGNITVSAKVTLDKELSAPITGVVQS